MTEEKTTEQAPPAICSWPGCGKEATHAVETRAFLQTDAGLSEAYIKHEGDEEPQLMILALPSCNLHEPLVSNEVLIPILNNDGEIIDYQGNKEADFMIGVFRGLVSSDHIAAQTGETPLGYVDIPTDAPEEAKDNKEETTP